MVSWHMKTNLILYFKLNVFITCNFLQIILLFFYFIFHLTLFKKKLICHSLFIFIIINFVSLFFIIFKIFLKIFIYFFIYFY